MQGAPYGLRAETIAALAHAHDLLMADGYRGYPYTAEEGRIASCMERCRDSIFHLLVAVKVYADDRAASAALTWLNADEGERSETVAEALAEYLTVES